MENSIKLTNSQIKLLENLPEQGMGYQIVDIEIKNGIVLKKRVVFNSMYLQLNVNEDFCVKDIIKIELHKD